MNKTTSPSLTLLVTNVQLLESGLTAQSTWTESGGTIGSDTFATWRLKDSQNKVRAVHCELVMIDGAFCIKDRCGETYVNGSHMPLGLNQLAKLEHKDEVGVGPYQLRVLMGTTVDEPTVGSLDTMFTDGEVDLLADATEDEEERTEETRVDADPLLALDAVKTRTEETESLIDDPVPEVNEESDSIVPEDNLVLNELNYTPQADSEYEMTSSISLKRILGFGSRKKEAKKIAENQSHAEPIPQSHYNDTTLNNVSEGSPMDDKVLDLLEEEVAKSFQSEQAETQHQSNETSVSPTGSSKHLLTGPMLQGLGVDISDDNDMKRMHMLSEEMGESLQACVKGLLDLHQQVSEGRFGTMNRNLQPIEDNPLRLGLSYEETVRTMYDSNKSLVHLSAPAAISESLKNVRDHNDAMQHATSEALTQILAAFSPEVLLRRFQHYRRNTDAHASNDQAWAWDMYCNYYKELTSNRQRGFEKLFWEIFEQAYDKKIREKQLEL
ncbi:MULTISPECIES: type VI secretion system-associated FHA domain protein TagH [Vibrio]|uniref:Type VI secretion system-associated FHA domain protein TagH n=2 Tax=Vibrio TaxID=662 RepID=A0A7X4LJH8_9VIBR|nr:MULTISPECIES: type VI secretion system-associated FHA domain protein TagH [Vibrio]MBF9003341.1 type VI secretion system-associated FHA domain protein TagH [Vibrio nitrifigilis]MZI93105.1 type VI secretion system-associated FHA domain protein TagH [Vibrio eleionomae]